MPIKRWNGQLRRHDEKISPRELDPSRLYVVPLGIGDAFTRIFFNSSLLVIGGGQVVLIDAPAPLRRVLHDAGRRCAMDLDLDTIDHVVLTHLHGDHCNGLEEMAYYKRYGLGHDRPNLYVMEEIIDTLWENRLSGAMGSKKGEKRTLDSWFRVHTISDSGSFYLSGDSSHTGLLFETIRTRHSVPCIGMRIRLGRHVLGYSGDGEFDPARVKFLSEADLIIHEAGGTANHTTLADLRQVAPEIRRKMALIHIPDSFNYFESDIPLLSEGALYDVAEGPRLARQEVD